MITNELDALIFVMLVYEKYYPEACLHVYVISAVAHRARVYSPYCATFIC